MSDPLIGTSLVFIVLLFAFIAAFLWLKKDRAAHKQFLLTLRKDVDFLNSEPFTSARKKNDKPQS